MSSVTVTRMEGRGRARGVGWRSQSEVWECCCGDSDPGAGARAGGARGASPWGLRGAPRILSVLLSVPYVVRVNLRLAQSFSPHSQCAEAIKKDVLVVL